MDNFENSRKIMSPSQKSFSRIHYLSKFFGRANFFCLSIVNTNISSRSCLPPRRASPGNKIFQSFLGRQNFVCLRIIDSKSKACLDCASLSDERLLQFRNCQVVKFARLREAVKNWYFLGIFPK